jgi:hypothetical protein
MNKCNPSAASSPGAGQALALLAITAAERRGQKYHQDQEHGDTLRQDHPQVLTPVYAPLAVSRACPEATELTAVPAADQGGLRKGLDHRRGRCRNW